MANDLDKESETIRVTPDHYLATGSEDDKKGVMIGVIVGVVLIILLTIAFFIFLLVTDPGVTAHIRDVFIIFLAIQSLLVGLVMIILIIQLAQLINLLQNEVKPILDSTNETVSNLRGTTEFLSDNLVEPVMKANEYSASLRQLLLFLGLVRRTGNKKKSN